MGKRQRAGVVEEREARDGHARDATCPGGCRVRAAGGGGAGSGGCGRGAGQWCRTAARCRRGRGPVPPWARPGAALASHAVRSATVQETWPRPIPTVGDRTSAADRAENPAGWAFDPEERDALDRIMSARRDVRRFRPDHIPDGLVDRLLVAAHHAPSVGHSQPWRFVLVTDPVSRARAAVLADRARLAQAAAMDPASARHLLDLDLEGIREAPLGIVVCCDRRAPALGVLGRATFHDADMWSCACAIENLWLAARAEGLGVGWVTLFRPEDLGDLIAAPEGVATLGWLCVGWPDERPPEPGLERRGWSERIPLTGLVMRERWPPPDEGPLAAPLPPGPASP